MCIASLIRDWLLRPVICRLTKMEERIMAATQQDLDNAVTALGTVLTNEDSLVSQLIAQVTALIAKVQANPSADFSAEVAQLNAAATDIQTQSESLQASLTAAKGVTGS
jgi:hypothetical protein